MRLGDAQWFARMNQFYESVLQSQQTKLRNRLPIVALLQIGSFFEAYGDGATTLHTVLGLKLKTTAAGVVSAGFPLCAQNKFIGKLTEKGFAVLPIIQLEDSTFKKERLRAGNTGAATTTLKTKRTLQPILTACFFKARPLAILQKETCLIYLVTRNVYVVTNGCVVETLMQYKPVEIICVDASLRSQSLRSLFPKAVIRERGFCWKGSSATLVTDTLNTYLQCTARTEQIHKLRSIKPVCEHLKMDARTIQNLAMFSQGAGYSLASTLCKCKTKQGSAVLRQLLFSPYTDLGTIQKQSEQLKQLMATPYLETIYLQMPTSLTLASCLHPVFSTSTIVQTSTSIARWSKTMAAVSHELTAWVNWCTTFAALAPLVQPLQKLLQDASSATLATRSLRGLPTNQSEAEQALEQYRESLQLPNCKWGASDKFKWFLETSAKTPKHLYSALGLQIISQTATLIRLDSKVLQRLRLKQNEAVLSNQIKQAAELQDWLETFQSTFCAEQFQPFAKLDCLVSLAFSLSCRFSNKERSVCWPTWNNNCKTLQIVADSVTLPHCSNTTPHAPLVPNSITTQQTVLYGHNGSGKSTYMRSVATNLLLAHCGLPVFAKSFVISSANGADAIFLRFGSNDSLLEGLSSFDIEMQHARTILENTTCFSAVFCDELGNSCDVHSGQKIAQYFLRKFIETQCFFVFATHFELNDQTIAFKQMNENYVLGDVGSSTKNAFTLALECGLPKELISLAVSISKLKY